MISVVFFLFHLLFAQDEPEYFQTVVGEKVVVDEKYGGATGFDWTFYSEDFSDGIISYVSDYSLDDCKDIEEQCPENINRCTKCAETCPPDDCSTQSGLGSRETHRFIFLAQKPGKHIVLLTLVRFGKPDIGAIPHEVVIEVAEEKISR